MRLIKIKLLTLISYTMSSCVHLMRNNIDSIRLSIWPGNNFFLVEWKHSEVDRLVSSLLSNWSIWKSWTLVRSLYRSVIQSWRYSRWLSFSHSSLIVIVALRHFYQCIVWVETVVDILSHLFKRLIKSTRLLDDMLEFWMIQL